MNLINHKVYIGQSDNIERRLKQHYYKLCSGKHGNAHLQNSWWKYGKDAFYFGIVDECTMKELNDTEILYIHIWQANNPKYGYNKTPGGNAYMQGNQYALKDYARVNRSGIKRDLKYYNLRYDGRDIVSSPNPAELEDIADIINEDGFISDRAWELINIIKDRSVKCRFPKGHTSWNKGLYEPPTIAKDGFKRNQQYYAIYYQQKRLKCSPSKEVLEALLELYENDLETIKKTNIRSIRTKEQLMERLNNGRD